MPLYEYECEACNERVEVLQSIGDPPPHCSANHEMKKMISRFSSRKGGGVYSLDHASVDNFGDLE